MRRFVPLYRRAGKYADNGEIQLGLVKYNTGKPCKNGHLSERYTNSSSCLACEKIRKSTPAYKEYFKKYIKKYQETYNPDRTEYMSKY